jgi:hypothetical protein
VIRKRQIWEETEKNKTAREKSQWKREEKLWNDGKIKEMNKK